MLEQTDWLQTELDELISSLAGSHVKTLVSPESAQVCQVSAAACGPSFTELSLKHDPVGQSLRMYLGLELSELTECSLTWQEQVTPLGRWWWALSMPELRTDDTECGLLPTPQAYSHGDSNPPGTTPLDRMVRWGDPNGRMLPTPRTAKGMMSPLRNPENIKDESRLEDAIAMRDGTGQGRLSPCFVEWMMGYPAGYTDVSD